MSAQILDAGEQQKEGVKGLAIRLTRTDGDTNTAPLAVSIDDSLLTSLYGAGFAERVQWVQQSDTRNAKKDASTAAPLATANTQSATVVTPMVSSASTLLVASGAPVSSTGTGSFAATPLSAATGWDVSAQTGAFAWDFPLRTPPAPGGPAPSLALSYNSQSVDGETASTNNQPSAIGEGWSLTGGGFIERSYTSCATDTEHGGAVQSSGDLCWKTDNATISFGGHSGQLIRDSTTGAWKLQSDDGSRIEHLIGTGQGCQSNGTYDTDCWRLTTTDGTQYYFGLNHLPGWDSSKASTGSTWTVPVFGNDGGEPCNTGSFASSSCMQAWRWNLDYVVDTHNNAEAFYYTTEINKYLAAGTTVTSYIRGGQLDHIDYGLTASTVYGSNAATDRVSFGYDAFGRCNDTSHANCTTETITSPATAPAHPTAYPDVPFDQLCTATCTGLISPTFWTTGMLNTITTSAFIGGGYSNVDTWTLSHTFPDPGDATSPALWLAKIGHTGTSGGSSISEPDTTFAGTPMQNRVWVIDGLAPLDKWRIRSITTSTGAIISVNYLPQECTKDNAAAILATPETNTSRCFPQWWTPQIAYPTAPRLDLFHKYVVSSVLADPHTGGGNDTFTETDYQYMGHPAWRYDINPLTPDGRRTWSDYAGYDKVEIHVGDPATPSAQQTTQYVFYQGMDGDQSNTAGAHRSVSVTGFAGEPDSRWLAGRTKEAKVLNGVGGAVISDTINTPWASAVSANDGSRTARMTGDGDVTVNQPVSTGGNRTVQTHTDHDPSYGYPTTVNRVNSDAGTTCTKTDYAPANTSAWLIGLPKQTQQIGVACGSLASAVYPAAAITDSKITYDGGTWGAMPTVGSVTKTETADSYSGTTASTAHYATTTQTAYDSIGRPTSVTDALGHVTTTAYTPATGGPLTRTVTTNPKSWTRTTDFNPAWGVETQSIDENGKTTTATYDALGRRTAAWLPGRAQASNPSSPSIGYAYTLSQSAPSTIATTNLVGSTVVTSYVLYDGLGRQVQTQTPAPGSGTAVTDTGYDTAGRVNFTNNPYWASGATPSAQLFVPGSQQNISSSVRTTFDGAGRTTATILQSFLNEVSRTSISYSGADRVDTTPPAGGTPSTSYTNSLGQQTKLTQYLASTPSPTATQKTTAYSYNVQGKMTKMVDPAGNTWQWSFDVLGHQTQAIDPDAGTTTNSYDVLGNLITSTDGRNVQTFYTYDLLNRKTAQYSGSSATGSLLADWTYDTAAKGQLDSSNSYDGSTAGMPGKKYSQTVVGYDDGYRPTSTTVAIPAGAPAFAGSSFTTSYTYTAAGDLQTAVYPAEGNLPAETVRYSYGATGLLNTIRNGLGQMLSGTVYTSIGQVAQYTRSNGNVQDISTYEYDLATAATSRIMETTVVGSTFTTVADRTYTHDAAGNVTSAKTTGNTTTDTQCFKYDSLRDLTEAWTPSSNSCSTAPTATALAGPAPYWNSYVVDPATGNRTSATLHGVGSAASTTETYSYPAAATARPHAVSTVTRVTGATTITNSYGYNGAGMTTTRPGQTIAWADTGKLSKVTAGTATESSVYDASGALLIRSNSNGGGTTLYLGDTELNVANGGAAASATGIRTYMANGTPVSERAGSTMSWITTNLNGTSDLRVTTDNGTVVRRYVDPYGMSRTASPPVWSSPHGYLNAPTSTLSGLTQLGARAYDTSIGKFLSVDPVLSPSNPQQNNGYTYSSNNPVTMSDPSGLCPTGIMANPACKDGTPGNGLGVVTSADPSAVAGTPPAAGGGTSHVAGGGGPSTARGGHPTGSSGTSISKYGKQQALNTGTGKLGNIDWGAVGIGALIAVAAIAVIACVVATVGICAGFGAAGLGAAAAAEGTAAGAATAEAVELADASVASASRLAANQVAGNAARDAIASRAPDSLTEVTMQTTLGVRRLDVLSSDLVSTEAKVGLTSLTSSVRLQIAKDVELRATGKVSESVWEFFRSNVTGKVGPTGPLRNELESNSIRIVE